MTDAATRSDAQTFTFQAEIQQLLDILVHSLYTDKDIFLRELISNASDALNRMQFELQRTTEVVDPEAELAIELEADADAGTLVVRDTGIGMNRDELIENLGTIAQSGARRFLSRLQEQGASQLPLTDVIGQFGVGFYSVFMVADRVTVTSRSFRPEDTAWSWTSDGSTTYTLEPAEKASRGTEVKIYLKEDAREYAQAYRLRAIVKKHSDYIAFPIRLEGEVANQRQAIWRRPPGEVSDEDYASFYRQLTLDPHDPLLHLHIVADAPVQFYSVLFVPEKAERGLFNPRAETGLKLYARKVLIQEFNKDFLPNYLRFVDGVVDSEDLPLNVARESIQATRVIKRIGQSIKGRLLGELERLAADEPDRYAKFWEQFGVFVKEGIATEPGDAERLAKLLRFHSTQHAQGAPAVSLADYVGRMREGQEAIYYLLADDLRSARSSPHLDPFEARQIEVLFFTDPVDSFLLMNLSEFDGKPLRNVDDAELDLPAAEDAVEESPGARVESRLFDRVRGRFVDVLGERVLEVRESKVLRQHPVRLSAPEGQLDRNVQRVYRMLEKDYEVPRRVLELNPRHPLIHNLAAWIKADPQAPIIDEVIEQLYEGALLMEGLHPNPADMVGRMERLLELATQRADAAPEAPPADSEAEET